jgi:para-nitrobenzyl esterase
MSGKPKKRNPALDKLAPGSPISRRALIRGGAVLAGGTAAVALLPPFSARGLPGAAAVPAMNGDPIVASDKKAIVEISAGKVRGYTRNGIYTFKGIPYGATIEGNARFMPPTKPAPWAGLRSSLQYEHVAPQGPRAGWANDEEAWMFSWDDGIQGENCLRVNIWTPSINDNKKRPVMVWLHGGGFVAGSGQELRSYDGENLCKRGDVVVVSLNHRLGVLGYLDLSSYGDAYATSANVGMLDIVLALEWVRDNIGNFGGNAANVTIFGQSGGGGKVNTLMAMPSAKGLFHRAITQSGSTLRVGMHEKSSKLAAAVLSELGLSDSQVSQLHTLPFERLVAAAVAVTQRNARPGPPDFRRLADQLGWVPVVDGKIIPQHPFDPSAPATSSGVPLLVGTVLNEFLTAINHPEYESMTEEAVAKRVSDLYGENSARVIDVFRQAHPGAKPFDILSLIFAAPVRQAAVTQAERKAALGAAPAYLYWFTWQTPVLDGRPRAFHCSELAFCFDNTDQCENMTGGGPEARALAAKVSEAWLAFARSGNPNHRGLPEWPAFTAEKCPTMRFDKVSAVENNPDGVERKVIAEA